MLTIRKCALDPYASLLVTEYENNWSEFEEVFSQYGVETVPEGAIAYAIIGAFISRLGRPDHHCRKELPGDGGEYAPRIRLLSAHYVPARSALSGLSGVQTGTPYEQLYTQGWHYLFGLVNRKLAEKGYFIAPYAENRDYVGFLPFVFKTSIYDVDVVVSNDQ